jgi:hypothetical protein
MISIPRGTYASMHTALLQKVIAEEGSIRRAARVLEVPRSTLGSWLRTTTGDDDHDGAGLDGGDDPLVDEPVVNEMTKCRASSGGLDPR